MLVNKLWQQILGAMVLLSFGIPMIPSHAQASIEADNNTLVAQLGAVSYCRRVTAENGLNVRGKPSRNSSVIDALPHRSTVTLDRSVSLANLPTWVLISEPIRGYVHSNYLTAEKPSRCSE